MGLTQRQQIKFNLNIDTKKSNQIMRSHILLPRPHGGMRRVAVLCEDQDDAAKATAAGAVCAGGKELHAHVTNSTFLSLSFVFIWLFFL